MGLSKTSQSSWLSSLANNENQALCGFFQITLDLLLRFSFCEITPFGKHAEAKTQSCWYYFSFGKTNNLGMCLYQLPLAIEQTHPVFGD